jgi:hypothetical protein
MALITDQELPMPTVSTNRANASARWRIRKPSGRVRREWTTLGRAELRASLLTRCAGGTKDWHEATVGQGRRGLWSVSRPIVGLYTTFMRRSLSPSRIPMPSRAYSGERN